MNRATKWFFALVAAQAVFLLAWAGYHEVVRQRAPAILLKGRPVDPQDLLRGDYMTISYDISSIPAASGEAPGGKETGSDAWVLLERRERYHVAVRASHERLQPGPGQILVRGTFGSDWRRGNGASAGGNRGRRRAALLGYPRARIRRAG